MNVILCGYNWPGCKALDLLIGQGHEVFVFTHPNPYHIPSVVDSCEELKVRYSIANISNSKLPFRPDVICSVYYRHLISRSVIESCDGKIFNLHPSLLPKYRGCSSLTWAIINGEGEAGYTYHYIDEGCDTGPIIIQKPIKIETWDTQQTLYLRTIFAGMTDFQNAFDLVAEGKMGRPQSGQSSFYPRGCPHGGEINPLWEIEYIERFIRAMNYPPYAPAKYNGREVRTIHDYFALVSKSNLKT